MSKWLQAYNRESSDFEEWINDQMQLAASEEYGSDYEHLVVRRTSSMWARKNLLISYLCC